MQPTAFASKQEFFFGTVLPCPIFHGSQSRVKNPISDFQDFIELLWISLILPSQVNNSLLRSLRTLNDLEDPRKHLNSTLMSEIELVAQSCGFEVDFGFELDYHNHRIRSLDSRQLGLSLTSLIVSFASIRLFGEIILDFYHGITSAMSIGGLFFLNFLLENLIYLL